MPVPCGEANITLGTLRVALSARKIESRRVLQTQYGDGYKARTLDGINTRIIRWEVETPPMQAEAANAFEQELIALDIKGFDWCPPYSGQTDKYRLDPVEWTKSYEDGLVRFAFTLVPEPMPGVIGWP